jgi:hypothetical protein
MKMFEGIQTFLEEGGDAACYALDILKIAEKVTNKDFDVIATLCTCINKGFIYYNWKNADDDDNFFMKNPAAMLSFLTGKRWTVTKESANYVLKPDEYAVDYWQKPDSVLGHFRLPDWDSLKDSKTAKVGKITSRRIFRLAK